MQIQSQGITRSQRKTYSKKKNTKYGLHSMNSEVKGKKRLNWCLLDQTSETSFLQHGMCLGKYTA